MIDVSEHESICLRDENERLTEEICRCDFSSTSMAEHSRRYQESAEARGRRSKACLN